MLRYRAVLFDLDGTLADTAGDLGHALNLQRRARGLNAVPLDLIRPHASAGARGLLRLGFGIEPGDPEFEAMRSEFLDLYEQNLSRTTALFPGVPEMLAELERNAVRWGIVTNKPRRFALPLLRTLGLGERSACTICGDMVDAPKPHPASLLEAARRLQLPPADCLYVGDDRRDTEAARAAGMQSVIALYGYLGNGEPPGSWGALAMIESPLDLFRLLGVREGPV
ncbi:MAG TPA: HAD-IA family hydrolase [Burkholderiales bacterium]|jgi:2-phosphoglycolate phosphatase|nr:HAD-IA family hydrolase [Burkholderiales bacterium]